VTACPTEAQLSAAIEGQLPDAEAARINTHLAECESCRDLIESLAHGPPASGGDPLLGMMLGEYLVEERIGQGGMGVVYRARQPLIGKQVAVKLLRGSLSSDPQSVQRLVTEAQAVNAIGHRGIIDIFSFGQLHDGRRYIVMEYLVGTPLNDYLKRTGKLTPYQTLLLLDDVVSALAAAHGAGIIHRDLKPSNLFLVQQPDNTRFVKVLDFGLSRPVRQRDDAKSSLLLGTPMYMAPELIKGGEVGTWTDLYALGVMAWQMLAGQRPFEGGSAIAVMKKQVEQPPPPLLPLSGPIPAPLEQWVMSLLEKDWKKRPQSTSEARQAVKRMLHALSTEKTAIEPPLAERGKPIGAPPSQKLPKIPSDVDPQSLGRLPHPKRVIPVHEQMTDPMAPVVTDDAVTAPEAKDEDLEPEVPTEVPLPKRSPKPPPEQPLMTRLIRFLKRK